MLKSYFKFVLVYIVNLGSSNTNRSSSLFGQIRTARDMRQAQLGIRLTF
jgi:hypothetical protein